MRANEAEDRELGSALKDPALRYAAPPDLEGVIRRSLARETGAGVEARAGKRHGWRSWLVASPLRVGLAFASGVLASTLVMTQLPVGSPDTGEEGRELVTAHVRSLMVAHIEDVVSSDQHTVKPWFSGKLDFSPPVVDLASQGYVLGGGRLDYLQDRPVAALVYRYRKHVINLFMWPADSSAARDRAVKTQALARGYQSAAWRADGLEYRAVSDASQDALQQFAAGLHAQASP